MLKHLRHSLVFAMTLLAPLLFGAAPARSDNQTTVGSLTLTANYNTIQFKLAYTGDDDQDATVLVRYWKTSSSANKDTAVVPVRDVTEPRFTGVIFWLDESTGYTVEAKISDPDGLDDLPNPSTITESITTRHSATPSVTGNTIWVSPSGNNNNPGTSSGSPKQTIAAALSALSGAGSQIRLLPGIYYETFQPMVSGNSSNYYSIVGDSNRFDYHRRQRCEPSQYQQLAYVSTGRLTTQLHLLSHLFQCVHHREAGHGGVGAAPASQGMSA